MTAREVRMWSVVGGGTENAECRMPNAECPMGRKFGIWNLALGIEDGDCHAALRLAMTGLLGGAAVVGSRRAHSMRLGMGIATPLCGSQ